MSEFKKIQAITADAAPKFPTSRKAGYVEDTVDAWLTTHFTELGQMIEYQNACVDEIERLEAELANAQHGGAVAPSEDMTALIEQNNALLAQVEALQAELANAHTITETVEAVEVTTTANEDEVVTDILDLVAPEAEETPTETINVNLLAEVEAKYATQVDELQGHIADLEGQLTTARTSVTELEQQLAEVTTNSHASDAEKATGILKAATEVAEAAIARAEEEAANIVEISKAQIGDLTREIVELEAEKEAAYHALRKFFTDELENLDSRGIFSDVNKDTENSEEVDSEEDA